MLQWWNTDKLLSPKDVEKLDSNDAEDAEQDIKKSLLETSNEGLLREWRFRVRIECLPGEVVCVTGNAKSLGHWHHDQMLELKKEKGNQEENIWVGRASIPVNFEVEYRYCICVMVEPEANKSHNKQFIIRQWESFSPRIIKTDDVAQPEIDMFGYHEDKDHNIGRGWLTSATVVQLKLFNNPIQLWKKKLQGRKIHVKVTPVNLITTRENELSNQLQTTLIDNDTLSLETFDVVQKHWPITEVAVLNAADRNFSVQGQFGHLYEEDDFMIFQIQVLDLDTIAYLLDFYTYSSQNDGTEPPYHIGFTCILPSIVSKSEGRTVIPITSTKHQPIGQITIEYLVVKPLTGYTCTMQDSMQTEWKDTWRGLDVGHRGIGSSFSSEQHKCADVRENTIASLKSAASHGADFVEFDVQLSRDHVPVLYHDFFVCISMKKKKDLEDSEMLQLPLKDLTLEQLHLLKLYHVDEGKSKKYFDEHLEEHQPFPTLKEALQVLDPHVGFNVEIKWTMQRSDGTYELNHPFDLNLFVDVVLKVVLKYAGSRPIVFSCFHPDICAMVQLKQNRYPVMFLTQCITPKYPPYFDPRCQSVPMAVHFSVCSGLLGINVHTEELLRDKSMVNFAKTAGLVLFCWGEDNNDTQTIKQLKEMGLHGVIYDKIDKFSSKEVKESIFRLEARESERNLIKAVAEQAKEGIGEPQTENQPGYRNYLLDIEKVHCVSTLDSASTSSGLSIWSVDQFGNPSDSSFEPPTKSPKDHIRYCKGSIKNTPDRRPI